MDKETIVEAGGRRLKLTNLQKIFYAESGFTKARVINYYTHIAPVLLPHLKGRPLTMKRYPDGADGEYFYEKECPAHRPAWVDTAPIVSDSDGHIVNYCLINDLPALVWAANLASLELHTSLSLAGALERSSFLVFDLDPGEGTDLIACARVALILRDLLDGLGLKSFPKTSGSKGMQLYIPLNSETGYEETKTFARAAALALEKRFSSVVVSSMKKEARRGKVFIDWSQNDRHKTTVCVYSLRAGKRPLVSTPVSWEELEKAIGNIAATALEFDTEEVLARVERSGDLFAPVLNLRQELPRI